MSQRTGNSFRTLLAAGGAALAVVLAACSDSGVSGPAMQPQDDGPAVGTPGPSFVESGDPDACYTITFDSDADLAGLTRVTEWSDGSDYHGSEIPPDKVFTIFPGTDWEQGLNLTLVRGDGDPNGFEYPRLFNTRTTTENPTTPGYAIWEEDLQYPYQTSFNVYIPADVVGGECDSRVNGVRTGTPGFDPDGLNDVTSFLTGTPRRLGSGGFADCENSGHVVIVEDYDSSRPGDSGFENRGNDGQGGTFTLGTFSKGTFFLKSLETIDNDDFEGPVEVSVNAGTPVALTPSNAGGNGVRTKWVADEANEIPIMTTGSIMTLLPRSGAIDNIEICGCTGRLGDFVWEDRNGNGVQDPGEPGIPGVTVLLLDANGNVLAIDETDADGLYEFTGLCAGTYKVEVPLDQPALAVYAPTDPNIGDDATDSDENPATRTYPENDFDDPTIDFGFVLDCLECKGGLTALDLRFTGIGPVSIVLEGDVEFLGGGTGPRTFDTGDLIQLVNAAGTDKMKSDIKLYVDGDLRKIHTSCSKPIGPGAVYGVFTVEFAVSKDNGVVCPLPPCGECVGGVTRLELKYTGPSGPIVVNGDVEFIDGSTSSFVTDGETFVLIGSKDDGKMASDIELTGPDGTTTKIHVSCSRPIGPGSVFGPYEVVKAYSKDSPIEVCPLPPPPDCLECKGGVTELTLRFDGPAGSEVRIEDDNKVIFEKNLANGEEFTIKGSKDDGKFVKNDLIVKVNGVENAKIHVSCSQPIGPGAVFGDLTVVQAFSKDNPGIEVCPVPPPPDGNGGGNLCETIGKPEKLVLAYDKSVGCTFDNAQDAGKWVCNDFGTAPPYASSVMWKAGDKDKWGDSDADRFGSGTAMSPADDIGDYVIADALLNGDEKLKSDTKIHLADGGDPFRFVKMHTSCSQPLRLGDVFGGLELVGYVAEKGQGTAGIVP